MCIKVEIMVITWEQSIKAILNKISKIIGYEINLTFIGSAYKKVIRAVKIKTIVEIM
jgi:hypothetical protein